MKTLSRRAFVASGIAALSAATVAQAADKVCADPKRMDSGQQSLRTSLNYTEQSPDPAKSCSGCGFFQDNGDGCGTCAIFNGPANPKGVCDSWGAKA